MNKSIFIYIAFSLFGFWITYIINYKHNLVQQEKRLQELVLFTDDSCYHIHHYITIAGLIIFMLIGRYVESHIIINSIYAFLIGVALEDFLFKDWAIIKNNCHSNKILRYVINHSN